MVRASQLFGTDEEYNRKREKSAAFDTHVCLICTVQSYNKAKRTVDVQPCIRERYIPDDGKISFIDYPLLVNVPVAFPAAGSYILTMPINKGDECIVIFNDLSFDNWWLVGNVQNPVEQRRHDLSDGIAVFGLQNQAKIASEGIEVPDGLGLYNTSTGSGVYVSSDDTTLTGSAGSISTNSLIGHLATIYETLAEHESKLHTHEL